jgi:hypothetical protein
LSLGQRGPCMVHELKCSAWASGRGCPSILGASTTETYFQWSYTYLYYLNIYPVIKMVIYLYYIEK